MFRLALAHAARTIVALVLVTTGIVATGAGLTAAYAQELDTRGFESTREQLQATLTRLEEAARASGYSRQLREQATREAELVRTRLEHGDFRVGDRIILTVRGQEALTGTVMVEAGEIIRLPDIGDISLRGVLRAELQAHLERELGRFIRDPVVTAESLIRLGIMGQVNSPGFMVLPASMLLEDALMAAGGPARDANLDRIRIERSGQHVWEGAALRDALVDGLTLDQLSLRAGDRIEVPRRNPGLFSGGVARTLLITLPSLILLASRIGLF